MRAPLTRKTAHASLACFFLRFSARGCTGFGMQIPQTHPPTLTFICCPDPEQAWIDAEGLEQARALEAAQYEGDLELRLSGPCDDCGGPGPLAIDGGEALCVECSGGEAEGIDQL